MTSEPTALPICPAEWNKLPTLLFPVNQNNALRQIKQKRRNIHDPPIPIKLADIKQAYIYISVAKSKKIYYRLSNWIGSTQSIISSIVATQIFKSYVLSSIYTPCTLKYNKAIHIKFYSLTHLFRVCEQQRTVQKLLVNVDISLKSSALIDSLIPIQVHVRLKNKWVNQKVLVSFWTLSHPARFLARLKPSYWGQKRHVSLRTFWPTLTI